MTTLEHPSSRVSRLHIGPVVRIIAGAIAAAALLAPLSPATADIVDVVLPPWEVAGGPFSPAVLDLNGDGIDDVQIGGFSNQLSELYGTPGAFVGTCPPEAFVLFDGDSIGPDSSFTCGPLPAFLQYSGDFGSYPFTGETPEYLGVRFQIAGQSHYGWISVIPFWGNSFVITAYAYESEPGVAILAGAVEPECPPVIEGLSGPAALDVGDGLVLLLDVSDRTGQNSSLVVQWYRDGEPLADGGRVSGATELRLEISVAETADSGTYAARIVTACGEATSEAFGVVVADACEPFDGSALRFASAGSAAVSDATMLLNPAATTIEAWIYWDRAVGTQEVGFITSKGLEHMELHTGNHLAGSRRALRFIPTPGVYLDAPFDSLPDHTWVHVAGVYDPAAGIAAVYINGVDQHAVNHGPRPSSSIMSADDGSPLAIGWRNSLQHGPFPFRGKIDEVRIWDHVRTQAQLAASMRAAVDPSAAGLLALYRFDEGTGGFAYNAATATGGALDLELVDGAGWASTNTCCAADFNGDLAVNSTDFFAYLDAFFAGSAGADMNHDFLVNSTDFFEFLAAFFAGC